MRANVGRCFEAADSEVEAHGLLGVQILVIGRAGEGRHVGVAAGVDDGLGLDDAQAALIGHDNAGCAVTLTNHIGHHRVVEELGAGLLHEAVGLELEALDVKVDDVPVEVGQRLADFRVEAEAGRRQVPGGGCGGRGARQVEDDAADDRQAGAQIHEAVQRSAHNASDVAAGKAAAFDDEGGSAGARGGDSRHRARAAGADDENIRPGNDIE